MIFICSYDIRHTQNPHDGCPVSIISVGANYKTNQYASRSNMLSDILRLLFSHSPSINTARQDRAIQNNECHKYAGQKLFLVLN